MTMELSGIYKKQIKNIFLGIIVFNPSPIKFKNIFILSRTKRIIYNAPYLWNLLKYYKSNIP